MQDADLGGKGAISFLAVPDQQRVLSNYRRQHLTDGGAIDLFQHCIRRRACAVACDQVRSVLVGKSWFRCPSAAFAWLAPDNPTRALLRFQDVGLMEFKHVGNRRRLLALRDSQKPMAPPEGGVEHSQIGLGAASSCIRNLIAFGGPAGRRVA